MSEAIVHSLEPITLVGAGLVGPDDFATCQIHALRVVAADGGAATCLDFGVMPEAVIGDLDSLDATSRHRLGPERVHFVREQESTDFDKALRHIYAPLVIAMGFTGARLDHTLACFHTLVRRSDRRCVVLGETDIVFLAPPSLALDLVAGTRVSLFPMGAVQGLSEGLEWPVAGLRFAPDGQIGTSNRATGPVAMQFDAPRMLVILPRACLGEVVRAFAAQGGSWPSL